MAMENVTKSVPPKVATDRIVTMDYLKGVAVIWFTIGHTIMFWHDFTWVSIGAFLALIFDWTGPGLFIAITVIGTMISIRKRQMSGNTKGMFVNGFIKSSFMLIVGEILNFFLGYIYNEQKIGAWHVFGANMITVIGLAQILTFGIVKLRVRARILLLVSCVIIYPILLMICLSAIGMDGSGKLPVSEALLVTPAYIAYYLLFYLDAMAPTLSWIIIFLAASIIFEGFSNRYAEGSARGDFGTEKEQRLQANRMALMGVVAIVLGVVVGGFVLVRGLGMSGWLFDYVTNNDPLRFYYMPGLPLFLTRHFPNYLIFNTGVLVVTFALLHTRSFIKRKHLLAQDTILAIGQFSFSIFIYENLLALIPVKMPLYIYVPVTLGILIAIALWCPYWSRKLHGVGSIEWMLPIYTNAMTKLLRKRSSPRSM
jgi:hypothetical protein